MLIAPVEEAIKPVVVAAAGSCYPPHTAVRAVVVVSLC